MVGSLRAKAPLILILAGAFAARVAAAFVVQQQVDRTPGRLCLIDGDAAGYWGLAKNLAAGKEFAIYEPPRYVVRMPGFPLVLAAGMKVFGERPLALRMMLAGVGTLACGLVYSLGTALFEPRVGLIAAGLAAVSPTMIVFSVLFLSETLFAAALLVSLLFLTKLVRRPDGARSVSVTIALATGAVMGLATLVRPTWILVVPIVVALDLFISRRKHSLFVPLLRGACILVGLAIVLAPWIARNWSVTGHFVATTLWAGPSLYDGLNPTATGASDMSFIERDGLYEKMSEYNVDRHYRAAAWDFAASHPERTMQLAVIKLWRFWNPMPNAEQFGSWTIGLCVCLFFVPMIALAAIGLWKSRCDVWAWLIPAGPILYFSAVHTVFVGSLRYRLPTEYALLVLTAVGVVRMCSVLSTQYRVRGNDQKRSGAQ